jgi:Rieske Fe-S protein
MKEEPKKERCSCCDGHPASDAKPEGVKDKGRRKFLGLAVGVVNIGIVAAIGGPVLGFLGSPLGRKAKQEWVPIANLADLPEAGAKEVTYTVRVVDGFHEVDRSYSIFLRRSGQEVMCIDPACTHLGCRVTYQDGQDRFMCPCHGGVFDKEGNVVSGPPPKRLDRHETKVEGGRVWLLREV